VVLFGTEALVQSHCRIAVPNPSGIPQFGTGTINVRLAAVRRLAYEASDAGLLSPELAAGIRRIKGLKKLGVRLGNWLSPKEARALWQSPNRETLKGKRDRAIIAVLLGCGLRRRELADLSFDHLQRREDRWAIVDLVGKGGHVRTVPVPDWVKPFLDEWFSAAEIMTGKLFRCVCRAGKVWGDGMTEKVVWHVVKMYAKKLEIPKLAPHDLRRSCARFCHAAGGELEQIQFLLGHVSVQTTERLGVQTAISRSCERSDRHRTNDIRRWAGIPGPSMNDLPTYQELGTGFVNTAAFVVTYLVNFLQSNLWLTSTEARLGFQHKRPRAFQSPTTRLADFDDLPTLGLYCARFQPTPDVTSCRSA